MIVASIVLAVLGVILTFTVVGSIIGLPMLVLAVILGVGAWIKTRHLHHGTHQQSS